MRLEPTEGLRIARVLAGRAARASISFAGEQRLHPSRIPFNHD